MKVYLSLAICGVVWVTTEVLLVMRLNIGLVDGILLATFSASCVGTVLFFRLIPKGKKENSQ